MDDPYLDELDRLIAKHRGAVVEGLRMARQAYTTRPISIDVHDCMTTEMRIDYHEQMLASLRRLPEGPCSAGPGDWQEHDWGTDNRCARCGVARTV